MAILPKTAKKRHFFENLKNGQNIKYFYRVLRLKLRNRVDLHEKIFY